MADSFTPNLNLRKPEVGAAYDTWGGVAGLNSDMDLIDAVFLATGLGTSVGIHVGAGKILNVEGSMQLADSTDTTKRAVFTAAQIATATLIEMKMPAVGGTIATVETVTASHPVGTVLSGYYGTAPAGFVMVDGRTIGDASSTATNRANADCERLFTHLWGLTFPVVGGRGASAAADWLAHRQLTLPDHSGRTTVGRDNLSGTARGVAPGWTAINIAGGEWSHALTIAELATHNHGASDSGHAHPMSGNYLNLNVGSGAPGGITNTAMTMQAYQHSATDTGYASISIGNQGSGTAHNNVQPSIAVDVIMAL